MSMARRKKNAGSIIADIIVFCFKIAFLPLIILVKIGNTKRDYMADAPKRKRRRRK